MNLRILLTALLTLTPFPAHTAIDDDDDRKFVKHLRAKEPGTLTKEEKAILTAANKVGAIGLCDGKIGGNAFLSGTTANRRLSLQPICHGPGQRGLEVSERWGRPAGNLHA